MLRPNKGLSQTANLKWEIRDSKLAVKANQPFQIQQARQNKNQPRKQRLTWRKLRNQTSQKPNFQKDEFLQVPGHPWSSLSYILQAQDCS